MEPDEESDRAMTPEPDAAVVGEGSVVGDEPSASDDGLRVLTGRFVDFHALLAALRRTRRFWLATAILGLLVGGAYHAFVPVKYSATATLYLAHGTGSNTTVAAQNDLAILEAPTVADRAIALLGPTGKGLTATGLLGKSPATLTSGNILTVTISGPTPTAAVARTNALVTAFFAVRSHLYEAQTGALASAANQQVKQLQQRVTALTSQIDATSTAATSSLLTALQAQRAADTSAITNLQQSVQQAQLNTLTIVNGSRVVTPGTLAPSSVKKAVAFDALTGLVAGLGLGMLLALVQVVLSDRVRQREDIAALLAAPVAVSIPRLGRHRFRRQSLRRLVGRCPKGLEPFVQYLDDRLAAGHDDTVLTVAADDPVPAAAALVLTARRLLDEGRGVVLVDDTRDRGIGRALGHRGSGVGTVDLGGQRVLTIVVPHRPWEHPTEDQFDDLPAEVVQADAVLVVASIDPGAGAWHLRHWAAEAIVTVTAGKVTARQVSALGELLDAAGVSIAAGVLLAADPTDETVGLPPRANPATGQKLDIVRPAAVSTT